MKRCSAETSFVTNAVALVVIFLSTAAISYGDIDSRCYCELQKTQFSYGFSTVTLQRCLGLCSHHFDTCPRLDKLRRRKIAIYQMNSNIVKYDGRAVYQCQPTVYGLQETTVNFNGEKLKFIQHTSCTCGLDVRYDNYR